MLDKAKEYLKMRQQTLRAELREVEVALTDVFSFGRCCSCGILTEKRDAIDFNCGKPECFKPEHIPF